MGMSITDKFKELKDQTLKNRRDKKFWNRLMEDVLRRPVRRRSGSIPLRRKYE